MVWGIFIIIFYILFLNIIFYKYIIYIKLKISNIWPKNIIISLDKVNKKNDYINK